MHLCILGVMPAKNPRLCITIEPKLAAQLRRLSELTGNSQSALIGELLEGSSTVFTRVIKVLEAANEARVSVRGRITDELELAQGKLERQLGLALDIVEFTDLVDQAENVRRRAGPRPDGPEVTRGRAGSAKPEGTPLSNRGVRSNGKTDRTRA